MLGIAKKDGAKQKKRAGSPDPYVLLFMIVLICAVATYFVPAGEFDRVEKGDVTLTVPGSYHEVESNPTGFMDFLLAFQTGMVKGAPIIFMVLFTGGAFAVIDKTGALHSGILNFVHRMKGKDILLIIFVAGLFSVLGTFGVIVNSVIAFIPLGIMIARAMKLDAIFGVALIYLGTYAGFNVTIMNPTTLGLSQEIAELPLFSGIGFRIVIYVIITIITIIYIVMYARKLRKDPSNSILGDDLFPNSEGANGKEDQALPEFTGKHKLVMAFVGIVLIAFIILAITLKWEIEEMTAMFIFMGIGVGVIARMSANEISKTFIKGCQNIAHGALIVGMARAVVVVLEDGKLLDTIVNAMANVLEPLPPMIGAFGMFIGSALLHFLISSGSGESVMLMPILTPLADIIGVTRQVAVQALMFGEGFVNCINPTSGVLMAILAMTKIPYGKWLKFMLPLTAIWFVCGFIFLAIGVMINWGPY